MKKISALPIISLLLVVSSCKQEVVEVPTTPSPEFLAAQATSVVGVKPETTEQAVLQYLNEFETKVDKGTTIPGKGLTTVKYHTGMSHSGHGMIVNGSRSKNPDVPPEKSYYHEFHYDSEGKLSHIVENNGGVRSLSNRFFYDGPNPVAKILFVGGRHSYSDLAFYTENGMFLKCRIGSDGKMLSGGLLTSSSPE